MKLKVERISPYGFKSGETWYNKDKESSIDLKLLKVGMEIEAEVKNDKYLTSFKVLSEAKSTSNSSSSGNSRQSYTADPKEQHRKNTLGAWSVVASSPLFMKLLENLDHSSLISEMKGYVKMIVADVENEEGK